MTDFSAIRIEGGLFGPDFLDQLVAGEPPGQQPADFGLPVRRRLTDEIAMAFADARAHWEAFRRRLDDLPEEDPATLLTLDAWATPFFNLLGYDLRYNPHAYNLDGKSFAISHRAGAPDDAPPVHIVGARQPLGRVPAGSRPRLSPHALLQEFLNRTEHLWGIVTNGEALRLLRDSLAIRRQVYVEFNLRQIFEEQRFQDFAVLYRLLHRTRLPQAVADARDCLLEHYYQHGLEQGDRVRERLRDGVEQAIVDMANGFLAHPANTDLRERLTRGASASRPLTPHALYQQLLRVVYRFLFLLVSEGRGLISADRLYRDHYGVSRLRRYLNRRPDEDDADDLWHSLRALWLILADADFAKLLGAAPLNGQLFEPLDLDACALANRDLLDAFWNLAYYRDAPNNPPRPVNYAALDVEELGSVYESLLDYHPQLDLSGSLPQFDLVAGSERIKLAAGSGRIKQAAGSERKTTGSYYTSPQLVDALMRTTLDPLVAERLATGNTAAEKAQALLSIRVLDPACGSGHFLLAAARRLGKALARVRSGEDEPAPEQVRLAIRDVVSHCIYGVDKNPLAVELARVALWLESHAEGKPLTFLDHRIMCGDSLVGLTDLAVLEDGIPDEAFEPLSGDDRRLAAGLKRRNRIEAGGQAALFSAFDAAAVIADLGAEAADVDRLGDDTPEAVRAKKRRYQEFWQKATQQRIACDLWTAAFFQARRAGLPPAGFITTDTVRAWLATQTAHPQAVAAAEDLAAQHGFFHWPLAFPDAFAHGGFDVVLGNPPWERIKLQEQEFFAARDPEIAGAPTAAARKQLIAALPHTKPDLWAAYRQALHAAESASRFLRGSGCYPLTGRGDINTYSVFAERMRALLRPGGRMGVVVPTGIATDDTNKHFFAEIVARGEVVSLYDFENRKKLFPAVDIRLKFSLLTLRVADGRQQGVDEREGRGSTAGAAPDSPPSAEFAFFLHDPAELSDDERRFTLTPDDFRLLNPNTRTAPIFRSRRDAELTKHIYRRVPVLIDEGQGDAGNPWGVAFAAMFHMANDSGLFHTSPAPNSSTTGDEGALLPLYEAKLVHQFDHRFATYQGGDTECLSDAAKADPDFRITPRYWVPADEVEARLREKGWDRWWLLGWRDITNATNERTVIASVIPRVGVGDKFLLMFPGVTEHAPLLLSILNSLCFDYAARQKLGGASLKYFTMKQLPALPPSVFEQPLPFPWPGAPATATIADFVRPRVLELTYTAWDLAPFARDLGYDGPPFRWDAERRFWLRAELDALCFHLYLGSAEEWEREAGADLKALFPTPRDAAAYILDQFPIVKRRDEERFGEYRTARAILSIYDAMAAAQRSGEPWSSVIG